MNKLRVAAYCRISTNHEEQDVRSADSERQYITLSIMSILQRILGNAAVPVNGDFVSAKDTVKGIITASAPTLLSLLFYKGRKRSGGRHRGIYGQQYTVY